MKYPKEYLDEIKLRLKVSQVVSKSVKLKKRGKEFVGLSPFSNEKTPSFTVNDQKGFYHCFSTSEHGNIFDFLMKTENLKFGEAVKKLAVAAGMQIYRFTKYDEERERKWKIYNSILQEYADFCHKELISNKFQNVKTYLEKRKLTKKEIIFFNIGYVDTAGNFYEKIKLKYQNEDILSTGLFYIDERSKKYIERFKGRIIFPIKNVHGFIIGFGGRTIANSKFAKYINSPETIFFKKGNNLFNINNAKKITNNDELLLVEGYMDVISLHKFEIYNVAANQGTALTEKQFELAWRFFKTITICFDGDKSGMAAAVRTAEKLFSTLKVGHNVFFIFLPNNLDPDNFINQKGKNEFINCVKQKISAHDFIWNHYYQNVSSSDPSSFASFEKKIQNLCKQIGDKSLSKYYNEYFLKKINDLTPYLNIKKRNFFKNKKSSSPLIETKKINLKREKFSKRNLKEYSIFYLIINNIKFFLNRVEILSEILFSNEQMNNFNKILVDNIASGTIYSRETFNETFEKSEFKDLISDINNVAPVKIIAQNKSEGEINLIFDEIYNELKEINLNIKMSNLENQIAKEMDERTYEELINLKNLAKES